MKYFTIIPLLILLIFSLTSCGNSKSKTVNTDSSKLTNLTEKKIFLEKYVIFRRHYEKLDFAISYIDGEDGGFPSPTEWDIRLMAKVPASELEDWVSELKASKDPNTKWVSTIPNAPTNLDHYEWFTDARRVVGFDRKLRIVLYRNHTD